MIGFHRLLITTAILFCGGFAAWSLVMFKASGGAVSLVLGVSFAVAAAALSYYLAHLKRFLGR